MSVQTPDLDPNAFGKGGGICAADSCFHMKSFLIKLLCGIVIGIGGVLPGVSGGVMAISLGLYEDTIRAISGFFKDIKKNFLYLLPLAIGMGIGVLLTSNVVKVALEHYEGPLLALFSGFVLGSIPELFDEVKGLWSSGGKSRGRCILAMICGLIFVLLFAFGENTAVSGTTSGTLNPVTALIGGAILSIGVVIPGVSSSFLLIFVGLYGAVLGTIAGVMDLSILFSEGLGAAIKNLGNQIVPLLFMCLGFGLMALLLIKLVHLALDRHRAITYAVIIGFVIGSVLLIQPSVFRNFSFACIILFFVGVAASLGEYWLKHHPKNLSGGNAGTVSQNTTDGL